MKKLALTCVILMALFCVWGLMSSGVSITINGNAIHSPFQSIASIWELVITGVVLFCVAILLVFIFAGVGLILLGVFAFVILIFMGAAFPFLLPLLIPLFIVLLFCLSFRIKVKGVRN
jgi:predicted exporter